MKTFPALEPGHAAFLRERAKPFLEKTPKLSELRERLLKHGGREVVFLHDESDLDCLLDRGRVFLKRGLSRRFIADSECHANAATLWYGSQGRTKVASGYGLCDRGLWMPHSWGVDDGRIIETTSSRWSGYFGFEMTERDALKFAFENMPPDFIGRVQVDAVPGSWVGELVKRIVADSDNTP